MRNRYDFHNDPPAARCNLSVPREIPFRQILLDLHRRTTSDETAGHYQGSSRGILPLPPHLIFLTLPANMHQVLKLCGPEPLTKHLVIAVVALQILCAYLLRNTPFLSLQFFLTAYIIGATANQNLFLAIHEISHNLAFKSPLANRLFAVVANLPIGVPYSAAFRVSILLASFN